MEGFEQGNVKLMDVFRDPLSVFGGKLVIAAVRVGTTVAWGTVQSGEFHRYFETGARCLASPLRERSRLSSEASLGAAESGWGP